MSIVKKALHHVSITQHFSQATNNKSACPKSTNQRKMKLHRLLLCRILAIGLAACGNDEPEESTKQPIGGGDQPEKPDQPGGNETDDVTSPTPSFTVTSKSVSLNTAKTYQEMEGIGASDCWLPNQIGQYWTDNRQQIATWLFSKTIGSNGEPMGIGLSMWRVNLGAGTSEQGDESKIDSNNRAEAYLAGNAYDWNKCIGQRYFMQQAKLNGVEKYVLFSNSPLVQYTKNGKGFSESGAYTNLKDDCYTLFASYMADVAEHFTNEGYNISHISPVNEPQYDWGPSENGTASQEGSGWQNSEVAQLARELDAALTERNLQTDILVPEAASWTSLYSGNYTRENIIATLFSTASSNYIGNLQHVGNLTCGHSYWTHDTWSSMRSVRSQVAKAANASGMRVWQTEWSMLGDCPSELGGNYDNLSEFDIAIFMSKIIHNDFTVAGCTSWSYWTAMSVERWSQKNRFELIKTTPSGGNYSDDFTTGGTVVATPNLWVLGNYSLFIRPGYKRIEFVNDDTADFFGSAWIAPDNSRLVIVCSNLNKDYGITLDMPTPEGTKSVYRYTTSETKNMKQDRFSLSDKVFTDPYSVTTIVYNF